jgi:hypothetical protein
MSAHIGLSFCVEHISYAGFLKHDEMLVLDRLGSISYPFTYNEVELFKDDKIPQLANLIKSNVLSEQSVSGDLSIAIESNLAKLKRVALPDNYSKNEEREHVIWDLSLSLLEPIDQYAFFKTDNFFEGENHKDYLTIAIQKRVVSFFEKLSAEIGLNLLDISVNHLVAEIALRNFLQNEVDGLIGLFKIGSSRLESTYLWNGNYYMSHYDRILENSQRESYNENLVNNIKAKIKQMENLFEQFTHTQTKVSRIFLYGDMIEDSFMQLIHKNISVIAFRLNPLKNIEKSEKLQNSLPEMEKTTRYVEPIGVVLDQ